jgi:hypothetical protein
MHFSLHIAHFLVDFFVLTLELRVLADLRARMVQ